MDVLQDILNTDKLITIDDLHDDEIASDHSWGKPPWNRRSITALPLRDSDESKLRGHLVVTDTRSGNAVRFDPLVLNEFGATISEFLSGGISPSVDPPETALLRERQARERLVTELQRSNHQLEQFAYVASHDLQEPLRMITGFLGLLEAEYGQKLNAEAHEYIDFAVDGAKRMKEMINDLLHYSRVWSSTEAFIDIDTTTVFQFVRDEILSNHPNVEATIEYTDLPVVPGRHQQLKRLFSNLLVNAVQHSGDNPHIKVWSKERPDEYLFAVADQGVGVAAGQRERIFDLFVSNSIHSRHGGTGIGLAICTAIVNEHGGRIWVEPSPEGGATFYFTLSKHPAPS